MRLIEVILLDFRGPTRSMTYLPVLIEKRINNYQRCKRKDSYKDRQSRLFYRKTLLRQQQTPSVHTPVYGPRGDSTVSVVSFLPHVYGRTPWLAVRLVTPPLRFPISVDRTQYEGRAGALRRLLRDGRETLTTPHSGRNRDYSILRVQTGRDALPRSRHTWFVVRRALLFRSGRETRGGLYRDSDLGLPVATDDPWEGRVTTGVERTRHPRRL